jgi:hypothetical protein
MELPESSMFVGRTKLSMRDIRSFNSLQNNLYLLHKSDCRWAGHPTCCTLLTSRHHQCSCTLPVSVICMTVMPAMCRHYVNNLVQYATGVEGITRKATREVGGTYDRRV